MPDLKESFVSEINIATKISSSENLRTSSAPALYELVASNAEDSILEKARAPATIRAGEVFGEVITLSSLSKKTDPKSSETSEKHPAANNDALTSPPKHGMRSK